VHRAVLLTLFFKVARLPVTLDGLGVEVQRGQWIISYEALADAAGTKIQPTRTAIEKAVAAGLIQHAVKAIRTPTVTRHVNVFTWLDFDTYDTRNIAANIPPNISLNSSPNSSPNIPPIMCNTQILKTQILKTQNNKDPEGKNGAAPPLPPTKPPKPESNSLPSSHTAGSSHSSPSGPTPSSPTLAGSSDASPSASPVSEERPKASSEDDVASPAWSWERLSHWYLAAVGDLRKSLGLPALVGVDGTAVMRNLMAMGKKDEVIDMVLTMNNDWELVVANLPEFVKKPPEPDERSLFNGAIKAGIRKVLAMPEAERVRALAMLDQDGDIEPNEPNPFEGELQCR
jgi:hypothetical protein